MHSYDRMLGHVTVHASNRAEVQDCPNSPYPHYPPNRRRLQSSQHGLSNLYTEGQLQAALPRRALLQKGNYGPFGTNLAVLQALNNVAEVLVALVIFMQQPISVSILSEHSCTLRHDYGRKR